MPALIWLLVAVALAGGELLTLDLVLLMLGVAALAGSATALVTGSLVVQAVVFAVTAVLLLAGVRPVARRHLEVLSLPSGAQRLPGRTALVVQAVSSSGGQVRVDGELWRAVAYEGCADVPAGGTVVVARVEGATLHVYPATPIPGELP